MQLNAKSALRKVLSVVGFIALGFGIAYSATYEELKNPIPNAQNTVVEVYSYACPFCYKYTKIVPNVVKSLPSGVELKMFHLKQKGDYGEIASKVLAVATAKDMQSGVSIHDTKSLFHKAESAYFNEYHAKRNRWGNGKDPEAFLKTGLDASGISKADYEKALGDKAVQDLLSAWEISYEIAKIQGVPAFVVNGKYLIHTNSITSQQDLESTIKDLLKK